MILLPLERLLRIATCQARPGVVVGAPAMNGAGLLPGVTSSGLVDTCLAAQMVANNLRATLRDERWKRRHLGARGQVGEAEGLRLMVWIDSRDDQPGMVAMWDMRREASVGQTEYGAVLPRPVLVIGRNVRSGEHFVMRYAPGEWLERLQQIGYAAHRF